MRVLLPFEAKVPSPVLETKQFMHVGKGVGKVVSVCFQAHQCRVSEGRRKRNKMS